MAENNQIDLIPDTMTLLEASDFWNTHSVADYPSQVVEMTYVPGEPVTVVAIAAEFKPLLEKRARESGISIETLVNLWVQEKLVAALSNETWQG